VEEKDMNLEPEEDTEGHVHHVNLEPGEDANLRQDEGEGEDVEGHKL
jgi:hypothetical protein